MTTKRMRAIRLSPSLQVSVAESDDSDFGAHVWPSGVVLAVYVWRQRGELLVTSECRVLELGCGVPIAVMNQPLCE